MKPKLLQLIEMVDRFRRPVEREDHDLNCEVWHRRPWLDDDCDCGFYIRLQFRLEDAIDELLIYLKEPENDI